MSKKTITSTLTASNPKIIKFFSQHQNLDFEETILSFIIIMEKLSDSVNNSVNNTLVSNLLENLKDINSKISTIDSNLGKFHGDTLNNLTYQMNDFKKEYINDLRLVLTSNISDKIEPIIKEQTALLFEKTTAMINQTIPKNNTELHQYINQSLAVVNESIHNDTQKLLQTSINPNSLNEFISNIEKKLTTISSNTNQIIGTALTATEQRLDSRINGIRDNAETQIKYTSSLNNAVSDLLKKMENSSAKGIISENIIVNILHSLYPSSQIDHVGQQKETGDIIVSRNNKPKVLIENKDWSKNVVQEEVKKFIHDIEVQKCSGIFLSKNHGIANKENFEINIHDGNVLIYVHEANNDPEKIKIAIDIIDHFKSKLDELSDESDSDSISKEKLESINREFQAFAASKLALTKLAKDFHQKFIKQIEDIKIPSLEEYLSTRYATSTSKYTCEFCNFGAKNAAAKSAHLRGCSVRKAEISKSEISKSGQQSDSIIVVK